MMLSTWPAKRPQPHPCLPEVGLRDGFVLLGDALGVDAGWVVWVVPGVTQRADDDPIAVHPRRWHPTIAG
jgi:hypothetical protein